MTRSKFSRLAAWTWRKLGIPHKELKYQNMANENNQNTASTVEKGTLRFLGNWKRDAEKQGDLETAKVLGAYQEAIAEISYPASRINFSLKSKSKRKKSLWKH